MAHSELPNVVPEELAALDELARLMEQYQTFLIARNAFANAARAQAGNASGTARPALERLHPKGAAGIAQIEAALRLRSTAEDPKTILEDLDPALKDLRALIAAAKWRQRLPAATDATTVAMAAPSLNRGATPVARASAASASAPAASRSKAWLWVGGGLFVGLFLGAFGTAIPRSATALSRVRVLLEPVVAAGSAGVLGYFLLRSRDLKSTVRKHWVTLLICSVLLVSTLPTAVQSAKELVGASAKDQPSAQTTSPVRDNPTPPQPISPPPAPAAANPPIATAPDKPASPVSAAGNLSPPQSPAPAARVSSSPKGTDKPQATRSSPGALTPECRRLLERVTLGEQDNFTTSEKALLQKCK